MSDLIDRQAAIDAMSVVNDSICEQQAIDALCALPSAQPEIVRCGQCKHYYFADNRIPQEQRYTCELDGDRWKADDFCSYAEREE